MTDGVNIATANKFKISCGLSIDIWHCPILKVKIVHISTVNVWQTMTEMTGIEITNT